MLVSLDEVKLYLRIDGDEEDTLITELISIATEICEEILRFKISDFDKVPLVVKQGVLLTIAHLYEKRESKDFKLIFQTLRDILSPYRNESW